MASSISSERTEPLYQKQGQLYTHTSTLTSLVPLSSLPPDHQSLFKAPPESIPYILTTPSTIFHAQGGGQPSDTGSISLSNSSSSSSSSSSTTTNDETNANPRFIVHQVRKLDPVILHMGTFPTPATHPWTPGATLNQTIDTDKRLLHSRIHTAGHILGLAINLLAAQHDSDIPSSILDGKASHYPGAAFVEFSGLIPGSAKQRIQEKVDELVARDLQIGIAFWSEERARKECLGVGDGVDLKGDEEDGVRVVKMGDLGCYACGGTHVLWAREVGRVVVRNVKRQKGVSKVGYEVADA